MSGHGRCVIIASRLFIPEVGAAAFRLAALARGLRAEGAKVKVISTKPPADAVGADPEGIDISRFPVLRDEGGNVRGYLQYMSFDIPLFFRLLFTNADLVVSEPPPTTGVVVALTSILRRRPYVYYAADIWSQALAATTTPDLVVRIMRLLEGFVLKRALRVIAISDGVAAEVAEFGVPADRIAVVGNGVETETFTPSGPVAAAERPYFVYTGTMSEWQGADIFIRALARIKSNHPSIQLRFFGQGSDEPRLKELAREQLGEDAIFGGVVAPSTVASWIRGATAALVSIVPNQGYDFAKPTKIYAAAACGTPVVFAGIGAGADIVGGQGLGYAVPYSAEAVANAMDSAITDADSSESPDKRRHRVSWAEQNASLRASGLLAARTILASELQ